MLAIGARRSVLVPRVGLVGDVLISREQFQHDVDRTTVEGHSLFPACSHVGSIAAVGPHKHHRFTIDSQITWFVEKSLEILEVVLDHARRRIRLAF